MSRNTEQFIAITHADLSAITEKLSAIEAQLARSQITPPPEWRELGAYCAYVGKSKATVMRWCRKGSIETRKEGGALMVRCQT